MIDYARARYGMSADAAHQYVYDITGVTPPGNGDRPWTYPFAKPAFLRHDWEAAHLIERIEYHERQDDAKAYALYSYSEIESVKLRLRNQDGEKTLHWLALTDKGGWSTPRKLERPFLPYRARTLKGAKEIWIFNGEKATDRACAAWNVTGTCLPNGENKWDDAYLVWFASAERIFLVTDNDATGEEHGVFVGGRLAAAGLTTHVVAFPGLPPKGDAWDYIEQGGTYEAAREIALASPLAAPGPKRRPRQVEAPPSDGPPPEPLEAIEGPDLTGYENNDQGNAERLIAFADGNLLYYAEHRRWLEWTGEYWRMGATETALVREVGVRAMRLLGRQARARQDRKLEKWAYSSRNRGRLDAMASLAGPRLLVRPDELDAHPYLVPCPSGTLDLETGVLRAHRREDKITRLYPCRYDPALGEPHVFLRVLSEAHGGGPDASEGMLEEAERMIDCVRDIFGKGLSGDVRDKVIFMLKGEKGNNSKTVILTTLEEISGPYAVRVDARLLTMSRNYGDSNRKSDMAAMQGARVALCSELPLGEKFDQAAIKMLTQGDGTINAARKHVDTFFYKPTAKIFLETNAMPHFDVDDPAFLKRLYVIDHKVEIPEERIDRRLREKLRLEYDQIFTWAAKRAIEVIKRGLLRPLDLIRTVEELKAENINNDGLDAFLDDCFTRDEAYSCSIAEIEQVLQLYAEKHKAIRVPPRSHLSRRLCLREGIRRVDQAGARKGVMWLRGLAPKLAWTATAASASGRDAQFKDDD